MWIDRSCKFINIIYADYFKLLVNSKYLSIGDLIQTDNLIITIISEPINLGFHYEYDICISQTGLDIFTTEGNLLYDLRFLVGKNFVVYNSDSKNYWFNADGSFYKEVDEDFYPEVEKVEDKIDWSMGKIEVDYNSITDWCQIPF